MSIDVGKMFESRIGEKLGVSPGKYVHKLVMATGAKTRAYLLGLPSPSTPVSSAPVSSALVSSALVSSAPVSSAPVSSAPVSSALVSSALVSSALVSSAPVSSASSVSAPSPVSSAPVPVSASSACEAMSVEVDNIVVPTETAHSYKQKKLMLVKSIRQVVHSMLGK